MTESTLRRRLACKRGALLGASAKVYIPHTRGKYAEIGQITGTGYPLVRVEASGDAYYRHIEDIELTKRLN